MTQSVERIASGAFYAHIPGLNRRDDIGRMAHAVQAFKEAAIEKVRLEHEAADKRAVATAERTCVEAERAEAARLQVLL
jgi:methyl-accepting chemotaxis protein